MDQVQGELEARDPRMQEYLSQVRHLRSEFESFNLSQVLISRNTHADSLATLAMSFAQSLPRVILVEDLYNPTEIKRNIVHIHQIRVNPSWMDPIVLFLKEDVLLEDKSEADKVWRKVPRFWLSEDQNFYKRSFFGPYLLCIYPEAVELLLEEYMKEFVEATQGEDLCPTGPSHKAIGGQVCRRKHMSMPRSAINAKDMHQTFTNLEGSLIICPVLGPLLNGVWTLLGFSLRQ